MAIEEVRDFFKAHGMENRILEFDVSSATVELAARALNTGPERIAKTLSFKLKEEAAIVVMAGDAKIDNGKFKQFFHMKAKMLSADEVANLTGHPVGGVCPFALKTHIPVYLDESIKRFETVFPACGSPSSAIELTPQELQDYSGSLEWIDVCKL